MQERRVMHSERISFSPLFVHPRGVYSHLNQQLVAGKLGDPGLDQYLL